VSRPPLPKLKRGDELVMVSGTPGRRAGQSASTVRVVGVGPKYVHVIDARWFDGYDAARDKWRVRKFLIEDQEEGERGTRVGYAATIATVEQREYDDLARDAALTYLREQGLTVERRSPWWHREVELANLLRFTGAPPGA
jgi:hypothetical protein